MRLPSGTAPAMARAIRPAFGCALVIVAVAVATVSVSGAAEGDAGYQGPSYSGAGPDPTGSKPQSKLWFNDGSWWADLWDAVSGDHHIFRLDAATQTWSDTGVALDNRSNTRSDVLWDGRHLYVASHAFSATSSTGGPSRLYRFSYDSGARRYTLDAGFPVTLNGYKTETLALDKDSTGRLWATWVQGTSLYITHSLADDRSWAAPFALPVDGASGLTTDDIAGVVAFGGGKVGVMWSNQSASAFYFAVHLDGQPPTRWQPSEVALGGALNVDDHVSVKASSDGRVLAAVKTSQTAATAPGTYVLERAPSGGWRAHVLSAVNEKGGRPVLLLDEENGTLHAFSSAPESGGTIYHETSALSSIAFAPGLGTPFLRNIAGAAMNDATSTKQTVDGRSGVTVVGGHRTTSRYWHNHLPLPRHADPQIEADFVGKPTDGMAPLQVDFVDKSTGAPQSWAWDFGDGTTSTAAAPRHSYDAPGSYTVRLTVTDAQGNTSTRERPHYVTALPLTAAFTGAPASGRVPLTVAFKDTSSGTPVSWTWDFGDGSPPSHQANPSHVYEKAGTYDVSLNVADAGGRTSMATQRAYITALPLTAEFTATPSSGRVPFSVAFTDTTLGTPVSWEWDFGDGSRSTERNPTHVYRFPGTFTVVLKATDAAGNTSTRTKTNLIGALPPVADFTGSPTAGAAPLSVAFRDASLGTPTSWSWDFGDGSVSSERNPTHVYAKTGVYTVTLTATDAAGNTTTKERVDYVSVLPLTADFAAAPASGSAPLTVQFSDRSVGAPTSWSWDFGDSTRPSSARNPTHEYDQPGTYTVTLRVTDATGDTSTKTVQDFVTVSPDMALAPAADAYVKSSSPTTNYGSVASLRVKNAGTAQSYRSYLGFDVPHLPGPVTGAKLRLYVTDATAYGGHVYPVTAPWTETGVTWSNGPAPSGPALARIGNAPLNAWTSVDLPPGAFIGPAGRRSLLLQQDVTDSTVYYSSREEPNKPQLVLTVDHPPGNRPPVARDDAAPAPEERPTAVNVLANDDPGPPEEADQGLTVDAITSGPDHGTATIVASGPDAGLVRYVSEPGHLGPDRLTYRVCDDGSPNRCDHAALDLDVQPVNDPPAARGDAATTDEDTGVTVDVLANDEPGPGDEAGQALVLEAVTTPLRGTARIVGSSVRYEPAPDFNGSDSMEYRVCDDGTPSRCATATVDVIVAPVNDPPSVVMDAAAVDEDGSVLIEVLANDVAGPDDESQQRMTVESVTGATAGGSAGITADGRIRYVPAPDYHGPDGLEYRACDDGSPAQCTTGSVELAVRSVNDAPVGGDDALNLLEDTAAAIQVLANDQPGPPNEALEGMTVEAVTVDPAHGTAEIVTEGIGVGELRYEPNPDYNGPDSFRYRVCDDASPSLCTTAAVDVTVESVNDAPRVQGDVVEMAEDGPPVTVAVLPNDTPGPGDEGGQALTVDAITVAPEHGSAALVPDRDDGAVQYTSSPDFFGADSIGYRVCDDGAPAACSTGTVDVSVAGVNDPPLVGADAFTTPEQDVLVADVVGNDADGPGESLNAVALDAVTVRPAHGTADVVRDGPDAGKVRYTPKAGYYGADAFVYRVCEDGPQGLCSTGRATIRLTISATVETEPVRRAGDAADDAVVWVNRADPAASVVFGTDKQGGIAAYDLSGVELAYRADGRTNNIDLREGFPLGGEQVPLVAASNLGTDSLWLYRVDPGTRGLVAVAARSIEPGFEPYGLCMYHSGVDDRFYAFITSRVDAMGVTTVEQWELFDDGSGRVDGRKVRGFTVTGEAEGCVADDRHGHFYLSEEAVGIWKYSAEPEAGDARVIVDGTGPSGQLDDDVEGLTIAGDPDGSGYLIASSQGDDAYAVYDREGDNDYLRTFRIADAGGIDGTEDSDGIDATTADLGPGFPNGVLVVHDGVNGTEPQNFKLVPLEAISVTPRGDAGGPPCTAPYAGSSPWNTPIPAEAVYEPDSPSHIEALEGQLTSDPTQYTYPVYRVDASTPRVQVTVRGWFSEVTDDGERLVNQRAGTVGLPLPSGALAADGDDGQIIMIDEQTGEEWGASQLERGPDGQWTAWNAYKYNTAWSAVSPRDASERPFFARGAGVPYLAGLVRPCEIARGRIDHALAFAYNYATAEYVFPATKSDGNAWDGIEDELDSHPGDMPEGARLQLDPTLTPAQIRAWGCTGPCLTVAKALQRYGMYIIDNSGRPKVMLEYDGTAVWDDALDSRMPSAIPLSAFKLLELPPPSG